MIQNPSNSTEAVNKYATLWELMPSGYWVIDRSHPVFYAKIVRNLGTRPKYIFPEGFNPNAFTTGFREDEISIAQRHADHPDALARLQRERDENPSKDKTYTNAILYHIGAPASERRK